MVAVDLGQVPKPPRTDNSQKLQIRRTLARALGVVGALMVIISYLGPPWFRIQHDHISFRGTAAEARYLIPRGFGSERLAHTVFRQGLLWPGLVITLLAVFLMGLALARSSRSLRLVSAAASLVTAAWVVVAIRLAKVGLPFVGGVHPGMGAYLVCVGLTLGSAAAAIAASATPSRRC